MASFNRNNKLFPQTNPDKFGYFQIWNQPEKENNDTIIKSSLKKQSKITNLTEELIEDFKTAKNIFLIEYKTEENTKDKINLNNNMSKNVNNILTNVGKIVSKIKNSQDQLSQINMNSLLNTKNQVIKSEKIEEPSNLVKKKENEYKEFLQFKNQKKKKSLHYRFLSDYYRRHINKALLNFNPLRHLENIKSLRKEIPEINEEFNQKAKLIEEELFQKTSPSFFRKNTKNFQKTFYNKNKNKENLAINTKTNFNFYPTKNKINSKNKNSSLNKIANFTSIGFHPVYKTYSTEVDSPKKLLSQKKINLYNFNQNLFFKRNKMKKFPDKEFRRLELQLMEDVCKNMINSIDKVEGDKNDFYNKYAKLDVNERKKIKDDILEDKIKAENILLKIKNNNLMKGVKNDFSIKRKKVNDDIKNYGKQINYIRDEIIHNIEQQESIEHEYIM